MIDQTKLLECMEEMKAIAAAQDNYLTQEEVARYLGNMELSQEQKNAIYTYLGASHIQVEGFHYEAQKTAGEKSESPKEDLFETEEDASNKEETNQFTKAQRNLKLYKEEMELIDSITQGEEEQLFMEFFAGDQNARNKLIESKLKQVESIAKEYKDKPVSIDDVIAEGNMGLITAFSVLKEDSENLIENARPNLSKIDAIINMEVKQAIEMMIDSEGEEKDWEDTILAKTNLLHEAAKYLAEELGRVATQEELADYTKISKEEIQNIMSLSEDAKNVTKPE